MQRTLYNEVLEELKRLDLNGDNVKVTVKNLGILASIQKKMNRLILNEDYRKEVREFIKGYNEVVKLQNEYWRSIEPTFKPRPLLKAIRAQAVQDIARSMTERISADVGDSLVQLLRTNITTGGSYAELTEVMRSSILDNPDTGKKGILDTQIKTIAKTSINQFSRQYTQVVSSDLGYEWFRYSNTEIKTSRGFCQSMVENHRYFHISQVPELLEGKYLGRRMEYVDNISGESKTVAIYKRTGLPDGFIEGTNISNFFVNAGGWNCGHSIDPVNEKQVPRAVREEIMQTTAYKAWESPA